jgi:hypothetical protein
MGDETMKTEAQATAGLSRRSALFAALGVAAAPGVARAAPGGGRCLLHI